MSTEPPTVPTRLTGSHCHCTQCRKSHGALYSTYLDIPRTAFSLPDEFKSSYLEYPSSKSGRRGFCTRCGGSVIWRSTDVPDLIGVAAGTLDSLDKSNMAGVFESFWCKNWVEGLDDKTGLYGDSVKKWVEDREGELMPEKKAGEA
ncbi:Mss4-like protein [Kalaharituber pfeilii]|nr:Mss4-like protein [Kalaharituber pfeilii]